MFSAFIKSVLLFWIIFRGWYRFNCCTGCCRAVSVSNQFSSSSSVHRVDCRVLHVDCVVQHIPLAPMYYISRRVRLRYFLLVVDVGEPPVSSPWVLSFPRKGFLNIGFSGLLGLFICFILFVSFSVVCFVPAIEICGFCSYIVSILSLISSILSSGISMEVCYPHHLLAFLELSLLAGRIVRSQT